MRLGIAPSKFVSPLEAPRLLAKPAMKAPVVSAPNAVANATSPVAARRLDNVSMRLGRGASMPLRLPGHEMCPDEARPSVNLAKRNYSVAPPKAMLPSKVSRTTVVTTM